MLDAILCNFSNRSNDQCLRPMKHDLLKGPSSLTFQCSAVVNECRGPFLLMLPFKLTILVNSASRQLSFHLRFTAVNARFWDFFAITSWLCIILSVVSGVRVSMRGTSPSVSDSGQLLSPINACVKQDLDVVFCPE